MTPWRKQPTKLYGRGNQRDDSRRDQGDISRRAAESILSRGRVDDGFDNLGGEGCHGQTSMDIMTEGRGLRRGHKGALKHHTPIKRLKWFSLYDKTRH